MLPMLEWHKNGVDDRSKEVGGLKYISTACDKYIPLDIVQGIPYMTMQPSTDEEYQPLPHANVP
jgi:hypothetical protein